MVMERVQTARVFPTHTGLLLCALINISKVLSETALYREYKATRIKSGNAFVAKQAKWLKYACANTAAVKYAVWLLKAKAKKKGS